MLPRIIVISVSAPGIDDPIYPKESLRRDYKEGMVTGISFCLLAMPSLLSQQEDETDGAGAADTANRLDAVTRARIVDALEDLTELH